MKLGFNINKKNLVKKVITGYFISLLLFSSFSMMFIITCDDVKGKEILFPMLDDGSSSTPATPATPATPTTPATPATPTRPAEPATTESVSASTPLTNNETIDIEDDDSAFWDWIRNQSNIDKRD